MKPHIIVPVRNGFAVIPYRLESIVKLHEVNQEVRVAENIEQLEAVVREVFGRPIE